MVTIGNKYSLAGTIFEIVGEIGDDWVIEVDGEMGQGTISKETLSDAITTGQAIEQP